MNSQNNYAKVKHNKFVVFCFILFGGKPIEKPFCLEGATSVMIWVFQEEHSEMEFATQDFY